MKKGEARGATLSRRGLLFLLALSLSGCGVAKTAVKAPVNATAAVVNTVL